jgi:hypothetical protein
VTPEHGSAKKRAKKGVRKKILTAQDPGREALEASMAGLGNNPVQVLST